ncbi:MAG TPA: M6 family metalloprotease domain-containing protein, partial [Candidatus Eisenbacteria bacterium]|nr:M6 family metalloprotease domain-containing protein [Candidatus Eisenbacteria bacterium]
MALCGLAAFASPARAVMPTRAGTIPPELAAGFDARLFDVPSRSGRLTTSVAQAVWNIPVILVAFSDQPLSTTIYGGSTPAQYFDRALFDTTGATATGSVFDYYTWVSGNRIHVLGRVVATITLPQTKDYYANNNYGLGSFAPRNALGFVNAALQMADPIVDWRPFDQNHDTFVDMVWVVHSGLPGEATVARDNLWSITSRMSVWSGGESFETRTPVVNSPGLFMRCDRFAVLPELSAVHYPAASEIGVYCHEFGHALGLPDLYDTSIIGGGSNAGPGNWSLMSTGAYGTDGNSPEYPSHLGAWPMLWLGWRDTFRPTADSLIVQGPIEAGAPVMEFWFQGESNPEHYLIENRQRMGYDRNLPEEGLIVYQIDETVIAQGIGANRVNYGTLTGLRLVEADGLYDLIAGRNRGDAHDPFPGQFARTHFDDDTNPWSRTFRGAITNIALREIEAVGDNMRYFMQVRAPGWQAPVSATPGGFNPIWPSGAANRAIRCADRSVTIAHCEARVGRPQILLRSRTAEGAWGTPEQVSESPVAASDPSIAAMPGGND